MAGGRAPLLRVGAGPPPTSWPARPAPARRGERSAGEGTGAERVLHRTPDLVEVDAQRSEGGGIGVGSEVLGAVARALVRLDRSVDALVVDADGTDRPHLDGAAATLPVLRDGVITQLSVRTGPVQGEWTVVYADELRAGDQVVGSVSTTAASSTDERENVMQDSPGGGAPPNPFGGD